ncbi:Metallo-dependent hydrolase [Aspergillus karnatakaensis]|uniref:Metallo-dependent hydrolase n=1 Tax=Aspergillus karnatakaensis TaxID=1810916 RepID=UPI003CCE4A6A
MAALLLQHGTVLTHDDDGHVVALRDHDVLVVGNRIKAIGQGLTLPDGDGADGRTVNCPGKIISPGFIDTHHHLWQTQLKGRFGDIKFMDYMVAGNMQSFNYTPDDIFWGQLAGCRESIYSGVTTVVDHAHMTYSPEHATEAIRATASSGLRSLFCYTPVWRIKSWSSSEFEVDNNLLPDWWYSTLEHLAAGAPFGNGRVMLGLGFDDFKLPRETVENLWAKAQSLGLRLITTHFCAHFMKNSINLLHEYGLLNQSQPPIIFSHGNGLTPSDAELLLEANAHISATPETELQMGLGEIVGFRDDIKRNASVGIDCHASNSSDILTQLRLGIQHARGLENVATLEAGGYPSVKIKLEEAFNLGTIQGAKAIGMEGEVGAIRVGMLADLVVFDAMAPNMLCAAEENPLAAVMLHANVGDVEMVIINGVVKKEGGRLVDVEVLDKGVAEVVDQRELSRRLLESREGIFRRAAGQDQSKALEYLYRASS